ncbi:MAG: hypothetical protein SWE60_08080 [Thermodesulfobacteriota bacterium]|nr:hypothetical protein [Thermodesulfobacteriota bacterium]
MICPHDGSLIQSLNIAKKDFVCPAVESQQQVGTLRRSDLDEASGIAASRRNPGVLWMHNDYPGDHPEDANKIYAANTDGTIVGTFIISVTPGARDPEDIAIGPGPLNGEEEPPAGHYIYWGDIGDNGNRYSEIWVKRIPEPAVDLEQDPVTVTLSVHDGVDVIRLQYPSGGHGPSHKDSETLMVDPLSGDIYVITKRMYPNKVYRAPYPQSTSGVITMEYVATLPTGTGLSWITAGDISPDGSLVAVRNDGITDHANIWYRPSGTEMGAVLDQSPCLYQINAEPQGEAMGWDSGGSGFFTVSEAHHASEPIWYFLMEPSGEQVTFVEEGSVWKYLDDGSDQGTSWREPLFDDSPWVFGPAELGYGDGDEETVIGYGPDADSKYVTAYFRRSFEVDDASSYTGLDLSIVRDDGAVVYLNGSEVFRTHMPDGAISFDTLASQPAVDGDSESTFFDATVDPALLVEGANVMAVEIHQQNVSSSDISFDLRLIGTRPETPSHALRVSAIGRGDTDPVVGSHVYSEGTEVSVYAYPLASLGYLFEGWIGGDVPSGHELNNPLVITMDSSKAITARFVGDGEAMPWAYFLLSDK